MAELPSLHKSMSLVDNLEAAIAGLLHPGPDAVMDIKTQDGAPSLGMSQQLVLS